MGFLPRPIVKLSKLEDSRNLFLAFYLFTLEFYVLRRTLLEDCVLFAPFWYRPFLAPFDPPCLLL